MPTFRDVAPSEWLKWQDFKPNEERTYTLKAWEKSDFEQRGGKVKHTVAFYFDETPSKFGIVNKTNEDKLIEIFGRGYDLDAIMGKKITLWVDSWRNAEGEDQSGIRIKSANGNAQLTVMRAAMFDELKAMREKIHETKPDRLPVKPTEEQLKGSGLSEQLAFHNQIIESIKAEAL